MGDHLGDRSKSKRDTNRTNRTQSSGGKYESAPFWVPAIWLGVLIGLTIR